MSARTATGFPVRMEQARRRLERWRETRTPGSALPEGLWAVAVKLARRHGVYRTACALGLEYNKLKRLSQCAGDTPKAPPAPGFVELIAPRPAGVSPCRIELEGPRGGSVKIELAAMAGAELVVGLCRVVWGSAG